MQTMNIPLLTYAITFLFFLWFKYIFGVWSMYFSLCLLWFMYFQNIHFGPHTFLTFWSLSSKCSFWSLYYNFGAFWSLNFEQFRSHHCSLLYHFQGIKLVIFCKFKERKCTFWKYMNQNEPKPKVYGSK